LNDIVRLCQLFDLKVDMSEADWPLLTVAFKALTVCQMSVAYHIGDITEVGRTALTVFPSF
jgi:hypothetical protein